MVLTGRVNGTLLGEFFLGMPQLLLKSFMNVKLQYAIWMSGQFEVPKIFSCLRERRLVIPAVHARPWR